MPSVRVLILGSTGSIGTQTVEAVLHLNALHKAGRWPVRHEVVGLCAGKNAELLVAQAKLLGVRELAVGDESAGAVVKAALERAGEGVGVRVRVGAAAPEALVREVGADVVVAAMVGAAGLRPTLAAAELGRTIALANKETLVAAGGLFVPMCGKTGATLLPVDSEHSAVWQCLAGSITREGKVAGAAPFVCGERIRRVVLTASGGALRHLTREEMRSATPEMALKHPTWSMGAKVTIDSASLTNKAFEVIEAHWLFGLEPERIGVVIHPQSIIHSMVEYVDGSVMAQLSPPDMRLPIQLALTWPDRSEGLAKRIDWTNLGPLEFQAPEAGRYPALEAAQAVMRHGGTSGAVFNAASEIATEAFLEKRIAFGRMGELACQAIGAVGVSPLRGLEDVIEADTAARRWARRTLGI